jgi:hypothetical protein
MRRLRTTERVSSLAEGVFARLDHSGEGRERARAVTAWRHVAGSEVFAHARGFALRDGELLVFVDTSTWANELSVLSEHYRKAVNERIGKEAVGSMRFAVSKRIAEEASLDAEDAAADADREVDLVEPVALSETEREQLALMAAAVKSDKLRETVIAAASAHLQWRKGIEARNAAEKAVQRATEGSKRSRG